MTFPPPAFQVGDTVRRQSGAVGVVVEVRRWEGLGKIAYRVCGDGFPPRHYFSESVLLAGNGTETYHLRECYRGSLLRKKP